MLNKGSKIGSILMDLSKAFDTVNHNLLLCKVKAYGVDTNVLPFIQSHFSNRHQRIKVADQFSKWKNLSTGVVQGSVPGSLLFNILINGFFLFLKKLLYFATMQMTIQCIFQAKTRKTLMLRSADSYLTLQKYQDDFMKTTINSS